jgi:hypothetical protein
MASFPFPTPSSSWDSPQEAPITAEPAKSWKIQTFTGLAAVGSMGSSAVQGTFSAIGQVKGGGEATIEAAKYAGDSARSKGGGYRGAALGTLDGARALARETLRQQWSGALGGSDNGPKGSVADRINQRRTELHEKTTANASGSTQDASGNSDKKQNTQSETDSQPTGNGRTADEKKGTA